MGWVNGRFFVKQKTLTETQLKNAVVKTLECSAELLSQPGRWVRGMEKQGRGAEAQFCAIGAVRETVTKLRLPDVVRLAAIGALDTTVSNSKSQASSIVAYNDHGAKSAKDVVRMMEKTTLRLKKKKNI
jgi:hypothetical protein